ADRLLAKVEYGILVACVLLMAGNSIANVIGRYIFSRSIYFSEELNEFLIVLVTFIGLGCAARKGRHIRMSAFYDQLPPRWRKYAMTVICIITSALMFLLTYFAVEYTAVIAQLGKVTPVLEVPLYLTYVCVPFGLAITGIQYLLAAIRNLQTQDSDAIYVSYTETDLNETGTA
ncbi:MAG TPA: TRAP transporter small permease, partial [Xanthomonadales bacterium]|nr:TRAP transporter small permease [Xanthomonadales bacterium]